MISIFFFGHRIALRKDTQKPAGQHTFQQRNLIKKQTTENNNAISHQTDRNLKSSDRAQLSRVVAIARQQPMPKKLTWKLASRKLRTLHSRELAKQIPNSKNPTSQQVSKPIRILPSHQASNWETRVATRAGGRGETLRKCFAN